MDFNKKIFIAVAIMGVFWVPHLVFAQGQDYLYVFGGYDGSRYSLDSVDQRVFQPADVRINNSGTYELRLYKGSQLVSRNFLEISLLGEVEIVRPDNSYSTIQKKETQFAVALPLNSSFDIVQAKIQLLKLGQIVVEKRLIEIPTQILAAQTNSIITTENLATGSQYLFHLYYDNGQLAVDRDFEFKYDVVSELFVPEIINTQFPYKGEVVNLRGEVVETFQFDPKHGDPSFVKGKISVKAPYLADGQKVNFFDAQGNQLLSVFVSDSSFCNDDGVCNADVGEDTATCPNDCKVATPIPTVTTTRPSAGLGIGGMINFLIYIIIGLGVVGGGWYGHRRWRGPTGSGEWKWWKRRQEPPTQFPTPPLPPSNGQNVIN